MPRANSISVGSAPWWWWIRAAISWEFCRNATSSAGLSQKGADVLGLNVADLMTVAVLTCQPRDSLQTIMATMTANRVRHLPVEDDHRLAGIITIGDVVKARLQEATHEMDQLRDYVTDPH